MNRQSGGPAFGSTTSEDLMTLRRLLKLASLSAPIVLLLSGAAVWADDWPQFRGPNRDGAWHETGILKSIPDRPLRVHWRAAVGWGFASPVVASGRVYVIDAELLESAANERVWCFEELTGKPLWTHSYKVDYPAWVFDPKNDKNGPNATPIVQDGKLYILGRQGALYCFDASNGAVLWKKDLQEEYSVKEFTCTPSPLIEGNLLILYCGRESGPSMLALDKSSGKEVWQALDEKQTQSSPIVITAGGKRQLIAWTQESVTSLNPATGATYWRERFSLGANNAVCTPVFQDDLLLIGGLMLKVDADKPAASVLWPKSSAPSRRILSNTSTGMIQDNHVFATKMSGELVCFEARSGKQVWEVESVTGLYSGASIHLTPNGDSVFLFTDRGELIQAQLSSQGYKELGRTRVLEPNYPYGGRKYAWTPPAYANRCLFARNVHELICVSLAEER